MENGLKEGERQMIPEGPQGITPGRNIMLKRAFEGLSGCASGAAMRGISAEVVRMGISARQPIPLSLS